ncbi:hypothetical protein JKJ07_38435 [Actinoplanes sp. LDG1-01]|uniref:Uncharacterized protein n=1 Tax=Paractinoplanes lichenicola TaxID=2802976 RepID=A0ABS1W0D2_9ACTN|nr:hypothetical protein [Actinoplanes lichenicola]MBL7260194.1 hypothetical protein [Actinoplanes lichenicola]
MSRLRSAGCQQVQTAGAAGTHRGSSAVAIQGAHEQHRPAIVGELGDPAGEDALEPIGQRQNHRQMLQRPPLATAQGRRQLQQCQRIARRLGHHPPAHRQRQLRKPPGQQLQGRVVVDRAQRVERHARRLEQARRAGTGCSQQTHLAAGQPTADEAEHRRAGSIHPWQVVHHQHQRPRGHDRSDQHQHRVADQQRRRRGARAEAQGRPQCLPVRWFQPVEAVLQAEHQLVQPRVRHVRLELGPGRPQHPGSVALGAGRHGGQQRGLAGPRVAQHQRGAAATQECAQPPQVLVTTDENLGLPCLRAHPGRAYLPEPRAAPVAEPVV